MTLPVTKTNMKTKNIFRFIVMQGLVILGIGVSWHFAGFHPEILTALLLGYLFGVTSEFTRPFKK